MKTETVSNAAFLIRQIEAVTGARPGKTALQKFGYLARAEGVDLGYAYGVNCFGPFSDELEDALKGLVSEKIVLVERKGSAQLLSVDESYKIKSDLGEEGEKEVTRALEKYKNKTPSELGLIATSHLVRRKWPNKDLPAQVKKVRQFTGAACADAVIMELLSDFNTNLS